LSSSIGIGTGMDKISLTGVISTWRDSSAIDNLVPCDSTSRHAIDVVASSMHVTIYHDGANIGLLVA
jgi:hypothetical protein